MCFDDEKSSALARSQKGIGKKDRIATNINIGRRYIAVEMVSRSACIWRAYFGANGGSQDYNTCMMEPGMAPHPLQSLIAIPASPSRSVSMLACLLRLQCGCGPPLLERVYDSLETLVSNYFPALPPLDLSGL
jgi:hypothetical protein